MDDSTPGSRMEEAIFNCDLHSAGLLLTKHHEYFHGNDRMIDYFLCRAAALGKFDLLPIYISNGADINAYDEFNLPNGPLRSAATHGHYDVCLWLINNGAKVNEIYMGQARCMSLTAAARNGHFNVVRLLVENGADLEAVWNERNALSFAMSQDRADISAYLRKMGMKDVSRG